MSSADELLFSPLDTGGDEPWRVECRRLVEHLRIMKLQTVRPRGALLLEEFMDQFHTHGQSLFWTVDPVDGKLEFEFNGEVYLTASGNVLLNDPDDGWGVIEFNLFPNEYSSDFYVFADEDLARAYERTLGI